MTIRSNPNAGSWQRINGRGIDPKKLMGSLTAKYGDSCEVKVRDRETFHALRERNSNIFIASLKLLQYIFRNRAQRADSYGSK